MRLATAPPLPALRARRRLAEVILAARREPAARLALARLAHDAEALATWLDPREAHEREAVIARARQATAAISAAASSWDPTLAGALEFAAALFDAGLFFEVHEVLEPHWREAAGDSREVLQGLIQIAVGYQHLVNGNARGARALLGEGLRRVQGRRLLGVTLAAFADGAALARDPGERAAAGDLVAPRFPRGWRSDSP